MKWFERESAPPKPFDCAWCSGQGGYGRHDMCTGAAVQPHREGTLRPAAVAECACALRQHNGAHGAVEAATDPYRHVPLPRTDTAEERRRLAQRRRRTATVKNVLPVLAVLIALGVVSQCGSNENATPGPGRPEQPTVTND